MKSFFFLFFLIKKIKKFVSRSCTQSCFESRFFNEVVAFISKWHSKSQVALEIINRKTAFCILNEALQCIKKIAKLLSFSTACSLLINFDCHKRDSLRENSRKLIVQLTLPKVADHLKRSVSSRSLEIKSIWP